MVDPVSGRAHPVPLQRSPRPVSREGYPPRDPHEQRAPQPFESQPFEGQPFEGQRFQGQPFEGQPFEGQRLAGQRPESPRELYEREATDREAREREIHAPRHLADSWEGPVSLNRPLPSRRHGLLWLLVIPIIPPLLIPLYNRMEPRLFGLPFFYWFQLASVLLAIAVIALVYQLTKGRRPRWPR